MSLLTQQFTCLQQLVVWSDHRVSRIVWRR